MGAASAATIGNAHACSLSNGDVLCWGVNDKSQVGGPEPYYRDPFKVLSDAVGVSVGLQYSCAITKAGRVQCWGDDYHGTLGDGADAGVTPSQSKPVVGLRDVVALASGINHSCAVTSTQRVFCWGDAGNGQMGDGRHASFNGPLMPQTTPVEVPGPF
jgi:alpha-tubulin suppressor-like RCC1 family protein